MENIIVTGGFGFIGLNLMSFLTKKLHFIHNIDNYSLGHSYYDTLSRLQKLIKNYKEDINNNKVIKKYSRNQKYKKFFTWRLKAMLTDQ